MSIKLLVLNKAGCRPGARGHGFVIADVAASPPFIGGDENPWPNPKQKQKQQA